MARIAITMATRSEAPTARRPASVRLRSPGGAGVRGGRDGGRHSPIITRKFKSGTQKSSPTQGGSPASMARRALIDRPIQANGSAQSMRACMAHTGACSFRRRRLANSQRLNGRPSAKCRTKESPPSFSTISRTPVTR